MVWRRGSFLFMSSLFDPQLRKISPAVYASETIGDKIANYILRAFKAETHYRCRRAAGA